MQNKTWFLDHIKETPLPDGGMRLSGPQYAFDAMAKYLESLDADEKSKAPAVIAGVVIVVGVCAVGMYYWRKWRSQ